jgi:hypothetical protein
MASARQSMWVATSGTSCPSGLADEAIPVADADPDAVIGVGAVVEDITEHRAAERRTAQRQQVLLSISAAPRRQGRRGDC